MLLQRYSAQLPSDARRLLGVFGLPLSEGLERGKRVRKEKKKEKEKK